MTSAATMAPEAEDVAWAYNQLQANHALRLNSSLEALWSDRPRRVSLAQSRAFTDMLHQSLADAAFLARDDLELPPGVRVYGVHDIVLNCLCAARPSLDGGAQAGSGTIDVVFFSGVLAIPLLRFAVQIMLSRLDVTLEVVFPDGRTGDLHELAECALGYTIWHLVEDIPVTLAEISKILDEEDLGQLAATLDGLACFLFHHEVGHIACGHLDLQGAIVELSGAEGASDLSLRQEFEADAYAICCIKPEHRSAVVLYARIFLEIIADLETLGFDFGPSHPKATARVRHLLEVFASDIDPQRTRLLTAFVDDRVALAARRAKEAEAAETTRAIHSPAGAGQTRKEAVGPEDRLVTLPSKQICAFALEALTAAYRRQIATHWRNRRGTP